MKKFVTLLPYIVAALAIGVYSLYAANADCIGYWTRSAYSDNKPYDKCDDLVISGADNGVLDVRCSFEGTDLGVMHFVVEE